jgi:glutaconate CoA-transferase subunit A
MPRIRGKVKKAQIMTLTEAVRTFMHDGIQVAFSGCTGFNRNPVAFAWETVRQGYKHLHVLDRHGGLCTWLLNAVNAIEIFETNWMGWGEMAGKIDINMERHYKAGRLILEDYSHGATAMRFLAGAIGVPFMPYCAPLGSDLYNPRYDALGRAGLRDGSHPRIPKKKFLTMAAPFWGDGDVVLVPAARPELGVIHVAQVGDKGTARWRGIGTIDKELAFACDKVVIVAEEIVPEAELRRSRNGTRSPSSRSMPSWSVPGGPTRAPCPSTTIMTPLSCARWTGPPGIQRH